MKLNNKGMSIVELIISFIILMAIILGMFQIIYSLNQDTLNLKKEKELLEYKTILTSKIQDDLIMLKYKKFTSCTNITENDNITCKNLVFDDVTKQLLINISEKTITYDNINYEIPNNDYLDFIDVSVESDGDFLKIMIPIYRKAIDYNYGIKIVHPLDLE